LNTSLANMALEVVDRRLSGVFHLCGASRVSRYEFALRLAETFGLDAGLIDRVDSSTLKLHAKRPMDSSLDTSKANTLLKNKPLQLAEASALLKQELTIQQFKKKVEDYLFSLWEDEKFPVTIFRPTYIYGEDNNLYRETYLFDRITKGLDVPIPNGNTETQFIYISDFVKVFESAIHEDRTIGQAYNVTYPDIVTWQQLVETAMKVVNREVTIKKVDNEKVNVREYFPFRNVTYLLDTKKAEKDGLYMPQIDLSDGFELAYKWYCNTKPEVKDAKMNKIDLVLDV